VPRRGDRATPPTKPGAWKLVHHDNSAGEGWEELCTLAPGPMQAVYDHLSKDPRDRTAKTGRVSRLMGELGTRDVKGSKLEQWQWEVTGGGRVWYCPDDAKRTVHIMRAGVGHPKQTD
jgi:hypothetical protein